MLFLCGLGANLKLFFSYLEAAVCYLKAEQWKEAHNVLTVHLLIDFVLQNGIGFYDNLKCFNQLVFNLIYFNIRQEKRLKTTVEFVD